MDVRRGTVEQMCVRERECVNVCECVSVPERESSRVRESYPARTRLACAFAGAKNACSDNPGTKLSISQNKFLWNRASFPASADGQVVHVPGGTVKQMCLSVSVSV